MSSFQQQKLRSMLKYKKKQPREAKLTSEPDSDTAEILELPDWDLK